MVNASRALHRKHHFVSETSVAQLLARLTPIRRLRVQITSVVRRYLLDIKRVMSNMGNVPSVAERDRFGS